MPRDPHARWTALAGRGLCSLGVLPALPPSAERASPWDSVPDLLEVNSVHKGPRQQQSLCVAPSSLCPEGSPSPALSGTNGLAGARRGSPKSGQTPWQPGHWHPMGQVGVPSGPQPRPKLVFCLASHPPGLASWRARPACPSPPARPRNDRNHVTRGLVFPHPHTPTTCILGPRAAFLAWPGKCVAEVPTLPHRARRGKPPVSGLVASGGGGGGGGACAGELAEQPVEALKQRDWRLGAWKRPRDAPGQDPSAFRSLSGLERLHCVPGAWRTCSELPLQEWNLAPGYRWPGSSSRSRHHSQHSTVNIDITKQNRWETRGGERGVKGLNRLAF